MNILCCFTCRKRPKAQSVHPPPINSPNHIEDAIVNKQKTIIYCPPKKRILLSSNQYTQTPKNSNSKKKNLYPLKDQFRCLFCGGKNCPHEDYRRHKNPAIKGLNSDLIDGVIFASQRPSNLLIKKYDIINSFKENNISLIINLQRPGEHPYCGPNELDPLSGFAYNPSFFSSEGIKVKLSGWKDMDVPDSLYFMLDIIKEMTYTIQHEKKKVFVHCHAGYGRTGIVLACYKIYNENITADDAVRHIRLTRPKCIEQKGQMKYFVTRLREIFTAEKQDINLFLKHQCDIAVYEERNSSSIAYVPKIISSTFLRLIELKKTKSNMLILKAMNGGEGLSDEKFANICTIVGDINNNKWASFKEVDDITVVAELLYIWLDECVNYCIYPLTIIELFNVKNLFEAQGENDLTFYLLTCGEIKGDILISILSHIRKTLKKYEYEILYYCAMFLKEIYPKNEGYQIEIDDYEHMCEKIAIYLLGYNIDIVYENELNSRENLAWVNPKNVIFDSIQKTIILMDFLRSNIQFSLSEEMSFNNLNEEVRVQLNKTRLTQIKRMNRNKNSNIYSQDSSNNNKDKLLLTELKAVTEHNNPKERSLFEIYQLLRKHFSIKDNNNNKSSLNNSERDLRNKNNNNLNINVNTLNNSNIIVINENKNQENENDDKLIINEQLKAYQHIMDSNSNNLQSQISSINNNNLPSIQQASYNDSQEPIIQLKSLHSVIREIEKENSRHSAGVFEQRSHNDNSVSGISKKKKEFLSSIPNPEKKRSILNLKYQFSLRTKTHNQENNVSNIEHINENKQLHLSRKDKNGPPLRSPIEIHKEN